MTAEKSYEAGLVMGAEHINSPETVNQAVHRPQGWMCWRLYYNGKALSLVKRLPGLSIL